METLVVVTGGSSGLGAALLETAPAGAYRVDVSRSGMAPSGGGHLALDLAEPTSWSAFAAAFARLVGDRTWDRITVIHNAGTIDPIGFAGEVDPAAYERSVLLGSAASQVIGNAVLTAMRSSDARRELVLVSSGAASNARAGWSSYGAAKAAGDHWVRAAGKEQAIRGGVRVLAIAPGVVATPMQARVRAAGEQSFPGVEHFRQLHDEGALAAPADAARRLWAVLDDPDLPTGTVTDLRDRS